MPYKFIYIDDTQDEIEKGTINGLQDGGEIEINFKKPADWETLILDVSNIMPDHQGIILDLRLNGTAYEENKYAQYRGSTLAQELRTLSKENPDSNDYPIILISADKNIEESLDQTSLDLFDFVVNKNKLGNDKQLSYPAFKNKLKWLADGYDYLNKNSKTIADILNEKELPTIDSRFLETFTEVIAKPKHIIARFVIKQIIARPSFLINEDYLAARLGIDKSSEDWEALITNYLPATLKYTGAFSNYYQRWWMPLVEKFWEANISKDLRIRNTSATKKAGLIIEKSGYKNLKPITKAEKSKSDAFWVVCKVTGVPLDTIDGFIVGGQDDKYSWQESEYISLDEALRPTGNFGVSSIEKPRLQKLKDFFEQHEQRVRK